MEIKIGVVESPRELVVSTALTADAAEKLVSEALTKEQGVLTLEDEKGRRVFVPVARVAYVELAPPDVRKVGFVGGQ